MRIAGIGTDIIEKNRVGRIYGRYGARFAVRILHVNERAELGSYRDVPAFLAKRFVAKEAVAKALGTGFRNGVAFTNIEIMHDRLGKPLIRFHGSADRFARSRGIVETHLTISDERHYAIAQVILICQS